MIRRPIVSIQSPDCDDNNILDNNKITIQEYSRLDKLLHKLGDSFSETPSVTNVMNIRLSSKMSRIMSGELISS